MERASEKDGGTEHFVPLDAERLGPLAEKFLAFMKKRYVGQPRIVERYARIIERIVSGGFTDPKRRRPVGSFLLLGPSRVGKTLLVKLLAEFLYENDRGYFKIDCQDYAESHAISRLKHAPPGYIGYDDERLLTQKALDQSHYEFLKKEFERNLSGSALHEHQDILREHAEIEEELRQEWEKNYGIHPAMMRGVQIRRIDLSKRMRKLGYPVYDPVKNRYTFLMLLDEIERAHRTFHNILFSILDEGEFSVTPQKGETQSSSVIHFTNSIITATSNVGSEDVVGLLKRLSGTHVKMGFDTYEVRKDRTVDQEIYEVCRDAARKEFQIPLLNRFDYIIVARPLLKPEIEKVFDIQMMELYDNLVNVWDLPIILRISPEVKEFIVKESTDNPEEGASLLQKKIESFITKPLENLKTTGQVVPGDEVSTSLDVAIDDRGREKIFVKFEKKVSQEKRQVLVLPAAPPS